VTEKLNSNHFSRRGKKLLKFHHIGSTSIPSMLAKPILDILVEAPSVEAIDLCRPQLESLGYEYKGEYGIPG
jgi:GrpB-like predicted nucleotidyltransferase (UPF0157 family)